jgi:hypothetical protein
MLAIKSAFDVKHEKSLTKISQVRDSGDDAFGNQSFESVTNRAWG